MLTHRTSVICTTLVFLCVLLLASCMSTPVSQKASVTPTATGAIEADPYSDRRDKAGPYGDTNTQYNTPTVYITCLLAWCGATG